MSDAYNLRLQEIPVCYSRVKWGARGYQAHRQIQLLRRSPMAVNERYQDQREVRRGKFSVVCDQRGLLEPHLQKRPNGTPQS